MALLTDFFIAKKENYSDYRPGIEFPKDDFFQAKNLTSLELAGILATLTDNVSDRIALMDEFVLLTDQESEHWTYSIPKKMTAALIALSIADIITISKKASQFTVEELGWSASDFEPIITQLKKLSESAKEHDKFLYQWIGL